MSGNQPMPEQLGWEHGAPEVAPPPIRDLPADRHQFHKERLMSLIDHDTHTAPAPVNMRRSLLLRPAFALPALALLVAGALGVTVTSQHGGTSNNDGGNAAQPMLADPHAGHRAGVVQQLDRMALVAATQHITPAKAGQFVYIKSSDSNFYFKDNADTGEHTGVQDNAQRQAWQSLDGRTGWLVKGTGNPDEGESLDSNVPASLNHPSYELLASLPTDPDALLTKIHDETKGMGNSPDHQAFTTIGDMLSESYPPARLYSALFKAAARIPGVVIVNDAVDNAGRHGVAVAHVDTTNGERQELIFNTKDYTFLGERIVMTQDKFGFKAGTVTVSTALLDRAIVDTVKQLPAHDK